MLATVSLTTAAKQALSTALVSITIRTLRRYHAAPVAPTRDGLSRQITQDIASNRAQPTITQHQSYKSPKTACDVPVEQDGRNNYLTESHNGQNADLAKPIEIERRSQPSDSKIRRPKPLLNYYFEAQPEAVNCTTFQSTKNFLADPSHPFYIKAHRNIQNFNPSTLYWRVHVLPDVSKKAAIRDHAKHRIKHAFILELKKRGFRRDGTQREGGGLGLKGALLMVLPRDPIRALAFTQDEATENVEFVLDKVMAKLRRNDRGSRSWQGH